MTTVVAQHLICGECASEVEFFTDGRDGFAHTIWTAYDVDDPGEVEGDQMWRDGMSVIVPCPTVVRGDTCNNEMVFTGEGPVVPDFPVSETFPICEEQP